MPAHPASGGDRPDEPHTVEAVIDAVRGALDSGQRAVSHSREQREGEEAMGDRAPEHGRGRPLGIDMDELLVLSDLGEGVDPRLIDSEPTRDEIAPDPGGEFGGGNAFDIRPIAHPRSPNIAGGAVTPTPPSTGRIAPVV